MSEPVYFNGQELPALRPGKVWGLKIYPGGRMELHQYTDDLLHYVDEAVQRLCDGREARVWLDDAAFVVGLWNSRKGSQ